MADSNSTIAEQDRQASKVFAGVSKHYFTSARDVCQDHLARRVLERAEQRYSAALAKQAGK